MQELPKCEKDTQSEQTLFEEWHQQVCWTQGCRRPSIHIICNTPRL